MDDEIIEGEVFEPDEAWQTPWITLEVEAFQQQMDEMKQAYVFAADMIGRGAFQASPAQKPAPNRGYELVRLCGEALVSVGSWLLERCPNTDEKEPEAAPQSEGAWGHPESFERPARLPLPE